MENSLHLVLILLAAAVLVVILFRQLKLPAMIGYLLVGVLIGQHSVGLIPDTEGTRNLAEIGVVFLMFSIGLEFSLAKLSTMRRIVLGLGASQVVLTLIIVVAIARSAQFFPREIQVKGQFHLFSCDRIDGITALKGFAGVLRG